MFVVVVAASADVVEHRRHQQRLVTTLSPSSFTFFVVVVLLFAHSTSLLDTKLPLFPNIAAALLPSFIIAYCLSTISMPCRTASTYDPEHIFVGISHNNSAMAGRLIDV